MENKYRKMKTGFKNCAQKQFSQTMPNRPLEPVVRHLVFLQSHASWNHGIWMEILPHGNLGWKSIHMETTSFREATTNLSMKRWKCFDLREEKKTTLIARSVLPLAFQLRASYSHDCD